MNTNVSSKRSGSPKKARTSGSVSRNKNRKTSSDPRLRSNLKKKANASSTRRRAVAPKRDQRQRSRSVSSPYVLEKKSEKSVKSTKKRVVPKRKDYLIRVKNVWKIFGTNAVVKNVSFDIKEGESIGLMGANGAGKTMLVESICGLNEISRGEILYNLGAGDFREKLGIQFQENIYPPGIKVGNLVDFYRDIYRKHDLGLDIENLINNFDIRRLFKRQITKLSGGELQRVNILLAIINNPKVVFFDEISTGLDIQAKLRLVELIVDLKKKHNWPTLVVTHNIEDIHALCDRIIVMSRGEKRYDSSVADIIKKYGSLEKFISSEVRSTLTEIQTEIQPVKWYKKVFSPKGKKYQAVELMPKEQLRKRG